MPVRSMMLSAFTLVVLTLSAPAWCAERDVTTGDVPGGYVYKFRDDPIGALGNGATEVRLRVVMHAARDVLIRPRLNFIPELLKTVENM